MAIPSVAPAAAAQISPDLAAADLVAVDFELATVAEMKAVDAQLVVAVALMVHDVRVATAAAPVERADQIRVDVAAHRTAAAAQVTAVAAQMTAVAAQMTDVAAQMRTAAATQHLLLFPYAAEHPWPDCWDSPPLAFNLREASLGFPYNDRWKTGAGFASTQIQEACC